MCWLKLPNIDSKKVFSLVLVSQGLSRRAIMDVKEASKRIKFNLVLGQKKGVFGKIVEQDSQIPTRTAPFATQ
jgi:hypothetical protein